MVSYSSSNDFKKIGTISKVIILKTFIRSLYLVSPGQSIQQYEWRSLPMNMNVASEDIGETILPAKELEQKKVEYYTHSLNNN